MKLKEILDGLDVKKITGSTELEIRNITTNSKEVEKGSMFIAIKGFRTDGHEYIESAVKSGASSVVLEKMHHGKNIPATVVELRSTRKSLPVIASNFYQNPTLGMKLAGITGTNGKTTVSYMIEAIWNRDNLNCGVIGTVENRYMGKRYKASLTTPDPVSLTRLLSEMRESGVNNVVMEVSSHALDLNRVDGCDFDVAVFTNLTQDHLDYHETLDEYYSAKKRLFSEVLLKSAKNPKCAVINIDDEYGLKLFNEITAEKINYSLLDKNSDIFAEEYSFNDSGIKAKIKTPRGRLMLESKLLGKHNLYNLMAATGTALMTGSKIETVENALNSIGRIPGRLESVDNRHGINVLVDYAHTPDALKNVLSSLKPLCRKRLITVIGCGGDRDKKKRPLMCDAALEYSDYTVLTSDNPRTENPDEIIKDMISGKNPENYKNLKIIVDREQAISYAVNFAKSGDTLLIAGKGHEDYQIIGENKIHFDDREIAEKYLGKKQIDDK